MDENSSDEECVKVLSETWINTHDKGPDRLDTGPDNKGENTSSSENTSSLTPVSRYIDNTTSSIIIDNKGRVYRALPSPLSSFVPYISSYS